MAGTSAHRTLVLLAVAALLACGARVASPARGGRGDDALQWEIRLRDDHGGSRIDRAFARDPLRADLWQDAATGAAVRVSRRLEREAPGVRATIHRFEVLALPRGLEAVVVLSMESSPTEVLVNGAPMPLERGQCSHDLRLARDEATEIAVVSRRE